jgi:hypothetical protein
VSIHRTLDVWSSIFGPAPFCEFDFVGLMVFVKEEKLKYICKFGKELFKKSHALFWIVFGLYIKYLTVKDLTETLNLLIGLFSIDSYFSGPIQICFNSLVFEIFDCCYVLLMGFV